MKLVYLEWADATSPISGWQSLDEAIDWAKEQDYWVKQVGWVLEENKQFILISSQINEVTRGSGLENQYASIVKIPKTWIRKRKNINVWTSKN